MQPEGFDAKLLYVREKVFDKMIAHAKKDYPNEACGLLAGVDRLVIRLYQMANVAEKRPTNYLMRPEDVLRVFEEIDGLKMKLLAVYHSHRKGRGYPSSKDCELAFYPEASYIIISLAEIDNPIIRSFEIKNRSVIQEERIIVF